MHHDPGHFGTLNYMGSSLTMLRYAIQKLDRKWQWKFGTSTTQDCQYAEPHDWSGLTTSMTCGTPTFVMHGLTKSKGNSRCVYTSSNQHRRINYDRKLWFTSSWSKVWSRRELPFSSQRHSMEAPGQASYSRPNHHPTRYALSKWSKIMPCSRNVISGHATSSLDVFVLIIAPWRGSRQVSVSYLMLETIVLPIPVEAPEMQSAAMTCHMKVIATKTTPVSTVMTL